MSRNSRLALVALALFARGACAAAGSEPLVIQNDSSSFTVLGSKDGLSNTSVSGIAQDSKGFIWMGTQGGLVRYDGSTFKTWQNQPFNPNSLSTDLVQTLYIDKDDTIWAGTYYGLDRFDPATGSFKIFKTEAGRPDSLSANLVIAIERDAEGSLWVGTANGLDRLDEKTGSFVRYFNQPGNPRSIPHNTIRAIHSDRSGRLWIGTAGGGFALYNPASDDFTVLAGSPEKTAPPPGGTKGPPPSLAMQAIAEDTDGILWLGEWGTGLVRYDPTTGDTRTYRLPDERVYVVNTADPALVRVGTWGGGLFILDKTSGSITAYRHSKAFGTLPHDVVYSMLQDASGELWIGTNGGGVARLDRDSEAYTTWTADPDNPNALPNGKILSILIDSKKSLWVSVYSGGIQRLDPSTGTWKHFRHNSADPSGLADDTCPYLYEDREANLWVATNSGLCLFDRAHQRFEKIPHFGGIDSPDADIVYSILEDRKTSGVYWIGTYTKGLYRWDRRDGTWTRWSHDPKDQDSLSDNLVNTLAWDRHGRLWIGTNNGLDRFEDGKFVKYYYDPANRKGLSSSAILSILVDSRGAMWLSTRSGGLDRLETDEGTFSHYTREDGLPNNNVYCVIEDFSGDLWILTQTGIARRDKSTGTIKVVTLGKSLDGATYNQGAAVGPDGRLYFGSVGLVTAFDPARYATNTHVPPVFVTDFIAANQPKIVQPESGGPALHLASWENSVEFRFSALDFRDPTQNSFAWKLEGFDKNWTISSTRHFASYTNLDGGSYVFRVKASNNDGLWNDRGAAIRFTVENPVWKSPAALLLYLLLIALLGYGFATLRSNRLLAAKVRELTETRGQLQKASADAQRLADEAGAATKAKSDFIAMISHEIRNSLNGIIGVAELLSKGGLDRRQAEEIAVIRQSGNILLSLVNDVLDLSKVETDRIDLENLPWRPRELAERLRALHEKDAGERNIELSIEVSPSIPEIVGGDPTRIQQVLENLLSNAMKFTERGSVRLFIDRDNGGAEGGERLRLIVTDSGTGIGPEKLATIFEPYRQADASINRRYGGTGLGLSIVKRLAILMGGDISVSSRPGEGSTFSAVIPLLPAPDLSAVTETLREGAAAGMRILIVDDDPVNRRVAASLIEWLGGNSLGLESGESALEAFAEGAWDLVLLDEMMPTMDGFETAGLMRKEERLRGTARVPIFSMTARLEGDVKARCEEAGMDGILAKPITLESLGAVLKRKRDAAAETPGVLAGGRGPAEKTKVDASRRPNAPDGLGEAPYFNANFFEERYEGDSEFGIEILELWLSNSATLFPKALEAAREGDGKLLRSLVHRLGGSTSIITDGPVIAELRRIEKESLTDNGAAIGREELAASLEMLSPRFSAMVAAIRVYLDELLARSQRDV
ncbi:MAG TPA: two-component regulator propeller domain-containing protein [Rectinemataceae bacterium]|nr:two-component regulator propeller domain-containing protein [Rectinemataceae bacterium]